MATTARVLYIATLLCVVAVPDAMFLASIKK